MVDTMLHEHGAFERNQDGNLRSRSSLIKCAKDTGHYQERFMSEGVDGLLRDKTRPARLPKIA